MTARPLTLARTVISLPVLAARTLVSLVVSTTPAEPESVVTEQAKALRGKHDAALLRAVKSTPGITVAVAGERIGVHPTGLYPVIRRLEEAGLVEKRGRELHPVEGLLAG